MKKRVTVFFALLIAGLFIYSIYPEDEKIYVVITVDSERDFPPVLDTYKGIDEGLPRLLELLDKYNATATFFVTGNLAIMRPDAVKDISKKHEVGNHGLYHIEPLSTLGYEEKYNRIKISTEIIEKVVEKKIVSFKAPGHSCDTELINILEEFGYLTESSAYKGDSYPYHPSETDWTAQGEMNILRVPVSNAPSYFYSFFYYEESWIEAYDYVLETQSEKDKQIVVIGLHSWEFCNLKLDPLYKSTERICGDVTYSKLEELLDYLQDKNVKYITLSQAYEIFS
ncbi:MAG: polysaccharide deacetylase family protein [Candidatus Methanofastidiosia archaeon]